MKFLKVFIIVLMLFGCAGNDTSGNQGNATNTKKGSVVITAEDVVIYQNDNFDPLSYVTIEVDGNKITPTFGNIQDNNVDVTTPGYYKVTYKYVDENGNEYTESIHVRVTEGAKIDTDDVELYVGDSFDPLKNVKITDENGKQISVSNDNIIYNDVNTKVAGTYKVTYYYVTSEKKEYKKDRVVIVKEKPVVTTTTKKVTTTTTKPVTTTTKPVTTTTTAPVTTTTTAPVTTTTTAPVTTTTTAPVTTTTTTTTPKVTTTTTTTKKSTSGVQRGSFGSVVQFKYQYLKNDPEGEYELSIGNSYSIVNLSSGRFAGDYVRIPVKLISISGTGIKCSNNIYCYDSNGNNEHNNSTYYIISEVWFNDGDWMAEKGMRDGGTVSRAIYIKYTGAGEYAVEIYCKNDSTGKNDLVVSLTFDIK